MNRIALVCAAATWALFACARTPSGTGPVPHPPESERTDEVEVTDPMTEAEVRKFLDAEAEVHAADTLADAAVANGAIAAVAPDAPFDPADFDLPIEHNERVQFWMDYFQTRSRERFTRYLARMGKYEGLIRERLRVRGMPEDLIYLALIESGFSPVARSHASAVGIWQFIAGTGRGYGLEISRYVDERRDPIRATDAALDYLQKLYERFGSWYLAAAAYNTGENRVERILRERVGGARGADSLYWRISGHLHTETRNYVPKMIAAAILATYRDRYGFAEVEREAPMTFDVVQVPDATGLEVIAEAAGVGTAEVEALNPQFIRGVTPPGRETQVRIPAGRAEAFTVAYAKVPPSRRVRVLEHVVGRGETLSHIARRYGTSVAALQETNRIKDPRSLRAGRTIVVSLGGDAPPAARAASPTRRAVPVAAAPVSADHPVASRSYRVRRGDSLWSIARAHGVTVDQLRAWNDLDSESTILAGQDLTIRGAEQVVVYRVQPGDTLWGIARRHGLTADDLIEWNRLSANAILRPGDEVEVPLSR